MKLSRKWAAALVVCAMLTGCSNDNANTDDKQSENQSKIQLTISPASTTVAVEEEATLTYAVAPSGTDISNIKVTASGGKATLQGKKILFSSEKTGTFVISLSGESKDGTLTSNEVKVIVKTKEDMEKDGDKTDDTDNKDETKDNNTANANTGTSAPASGTSGSSSAGSSNGGSSAGTSGNAGTSDSGNAGSAGTSGGSSSAGSSSSGSSSAGNGSSSNGGSANNGSGSNGSSSNGSSSGSGSSSEGEPGTTPGTNGTMTAEDVPDWIYEQPITIDDVIDYFDGIVDAGKEVTIVGWLPQSTILAANGKQEAVIWNEDETSYIMVSNPKALTDGGCKAYVTGHIIDKENWGWIVVDSFEVID